MLFQIVDDILDVTGSTDELGKPRGSDERHGKVTYVSLFGLDRARELAGDSHAKARAALAEAAGETDRPRADHRLHPHPPLMSEHDNRLLDSIEGPDDLSERSDEELQQVAQEVRELIIDTIGEIGGHFGANLGTCELAVALHSLLDSPRDKILWDVGHQAYPHKVLTGRRERSTRSASTRGWRRSARCSSPSTTSWAPATPRPRSATRSGSRRRCGSGIGEDGNVVAVIGDGALTGGVAYEALHNAGGLQTPIVIVLNDNGMSISPNVGALSRYFKRVRLNPTLYHAREGVEERLTRLPLGLGARIERLGPEIKSAIKAYWAPGLLFEELDLAYVGVIDGHDVAALRSAIGDALKAERPVVVHIHTVKGKGFAPAEEGGLEGMEKWHAAKPGSIVDGRPAEAKPVPVKESDAPDSIAPEKLETPPPKPSAPQYTAVFADALVDEAKRDPRVIGITAAMAGGTGPQQARQGVPRSVLRRRHRRAGRDAVRLRPRAPGREAGRRDLLDLPPARLRPDRPRRLPPEAERRLRDGPRRPRRRRRSHPPRRLRRLLPAAAPEHRADGAARRGDARPHAAHGARPRRRPDRAALSARRRRRGRRCRSVRASSRSARARCCTPASGSRCSATATASRSPTTRPRSCSGHGLDVDGRRRALREAARRRAGRAPRRRPRADRDDRGQRPARAASARPCSSTSRTASPIATRAARG